MQILIAPAGTRWNNWIARVLTPAITAFDHKKVQLFAPAGTAAFDAEFEKATAECDAVIALNPPSGAIAAPDDWPILALQAAVASARRAALIRAPREPMFYQNAPNLLDCEPEGTSVSVVGLVRLLGSWRPARKARFLLGPNDLIARLRRDFGERQILVEYSIDSPYYELTRWIAAERIFSPGVLEVRTQTVPPDSRIHLRLSVPGGVYESQFSPIDRRVMDLTPTMAFDDPREAPRFAASSSSLAL